MPDEKGQPLPGEWWETRNHERAYVVASLPENLPIQSSPHSHLAGWVIADGRIRGVSWSRKGEWIAECDGGRDLIKHLPDCTGWDWQPHDWVELDPVNYGWHVLRKGVDWFFCERENKWVSVYSLHDTTLSHINAKFRCLRKDLPVKPPETVVTQGGPYISIEAHQKVVAERDALLARMREIEAKAKFFESVM